MPICTLCNNTFPNLIKIEGKTRNLCKRKFCLDCSPFGKHNTSPNISKTVGNKICTHCKKEMPLNRENFYYQDFEKAIFSSTCIGCRNKLRHDRAVEMKQKCIDYKGSKCICCSYDECAEAMDFHHLKQHEKESGISEMRHNSFEILKKELDKCILVCCRCHREIHAGKRVIA